MKKIVKKWWFWTIVIISILVLFMIGVVSIKSKVDNELTNVKQFDIEIRNNIEKRKEAWNNL